MIKYAFAIFISAFLVFQVQPIVAKYAMPLFGGAATVWIVCVVFFQVCLLVGYSYAHLLAKLKSVFGQCMVHVAFLLIALLLFLPIEPINAVGLQPDSMPEFIILKGLVVTVGLPYILVSASGPLIQSWFSIEFSDKEPYRLYALSNLGSLLGLLTYPFVVEPALSIDHQSWFWSSGFLIYGFICVLCLIRLRTFERPTTMLTGVDESANRITVDYGTMTLWIVLSGTASALLLSVTNQLTLDIASVPFLWILPLAAYLITFIVCFDRPAWYQRWLWMPLLLLSIAFTIVALIRGSNLTFLAQVGAYLSILFAGCMVCHGELYRLRPHAALLTKYYLLISTGGAIGGLCIALLAPNVFNGYWEMRALVVTLLVVVGLCLTRDIQFKSRLIDLAAQVAWTLVAVFVSFLFVVDLQIKSENNIHQSRSFYGVLKVSDIDYDESDGIENPSDRALRIIKSGSIVHGTQLRVNGKAVFSPTSYYGSMSGVGLAIATSAIISEAALQKPRVGAIGMGAATIASLCKGCQSLAFFELDPKVVELEQEYFGNLAWLNRQGVLAYAQVGDGRIQVAKHSEPLDVLAVDAFTGDAIPVHLLTFEAIESYFESLSEHGIIAIHVSNRHLDLTPILVRLAKETKSKAYLVTNEENDTDAVYRADWVLLSRSTAVEEILEQSVGCDKIGQSHYESVWTDQYSNVMSIIGTPQVIDFQGEQHLTCYQ